MTAQGWNVYRDGKWIDCVFFDADMDKDAVYRSLVNHDGYSPSITVRRDRKRAPHMVARVK